MTDPLPVQAVILAAGLSRRMGRPKLGLPWQDTTVLGAVLHALEEGGLEHGLTGIVVVAGGAQQQVEQVLGDHTGRLPVKYVVNPNYETHEMTYSLQVGLRSLAEETAAVLVALGDQPQILPGTVRTVLAAYQSKPVDLIAPSYQMHRGHPWLAARALWTDLLAIEAGQTLRSFFNLHANQVAYVLVDSPTILQDLDTPEDYRRYTSQT